MTTSQTFNSFFIFDENPGKNIDTETIWLILVNKYPALLNEDLNVTDFRKAILAVFADLKFLNRVATFIPCSIRDIVGALIQMRYDYFDKYVIKKIMPILEDYEKEYCSSKN